MREAPDNLIICVPRLLEWIFGIGWEMRLEVFSVASGRRDVNGKP
jgi:hypothetical protein